MLVSMSEVEPLRWKLGECMALGRGAADKLSRSVTWCDVFMG
jgi:hypothetical protein